MKENTNVSVITNTGSFVIKESDVSVRYSGNEVVESISSKLVESFGYRQEKEILVPITKDVTKITLNINSVNLGTIKKGLRVGMASDKFNLSVPLSKFGNTTSDLKIVVTITAADDSKTKSDIFEIALYKDGALLTKDKLSNYYLDDITLNIVAKTSQSNIAMFKYQSGSWQRVDASRSSSMFTINNPDFTKYSVRETGGNIKGQNADIDYLDKYGTFEGINDLSIDGYVTKGQFTKMIVDTLRLSGNAYDSFSDVPNTSTYYKAISLAQQYGIIMQYGGKFGPDNQISESEAIEFTLNAVSVYKTKNDVKKDIYSKTLKSKLNGDNKLTLAEAAALIRSIVQ